MVTAALMPASTGTPQRSASARAAALSPKISRVSGVGPTKVSPACSQAAANAPFSLRKP